MLPWPHDADPLGLKTPERLREHFFRHLTHEAKLVAEALATIPYDQKRACRFNRCCTSGTVFQNSTTGDYRVLPDTCELRCCPRCRWRATRKIRKTLSNFLSDPQRNHHQLSFITLTFQSTPIPLKEQLTKLRNALRKLVRYKEWRKAVKGAIYVIEVTYNTATKLWHPHLHIVAEARFIHQKLLAKLWEIALNKQGLCGLAAHVKYIENVSATERYLGNYLCKIPPSVYAGGLEPLSEFIQASLHFKFYAMLGDAHRNSKDEGALGKISPLRMGEDPQWIEVCTLAKAILALDREESWARLALMDKRDTLFDDVNDNQTYLELRDTG